MKQITQLLAVFTLALLAVPLAAQGTKLDLRFDHLEARAEEIVDINLDGPMLRLASKFLSRDDPEERAVREIVSGLTGIYVRSYEFAQPGGYSPADVERVRRQLGPAWQRIVTVRSREKDNVDIYVVAGETTANGVVIIAAEQREFTVVQLVGKIDLDRLSSLEGNFGIPEMGLKETKGRSAK
jgi:hypothetical protein